MTDPLQVLNAEDPPVQPDPIFAARSETFEQPFMEYSVPDAILKFRQGFGRLIRTQSDRGVVAILDKRVITKRYGRAFLDSLPQCTVKQGVLADLPRLAAQWLAAPWSAARWLVARWPVARGCPLDPMAPQRLPRPARPGCPLGPVQPA